MARPLRAVRVSAGIHIYSSRNLVTPTGVFREDKYKLETGTFKLEMGDLQ